MPTYLLLLAPSANRVYAGEAAKLVASELAICLPSAGSVSPVEVAGVSYLSFTTDQPPGADVAGLSASMALFERVGELLRPVLLPRVDLLSDDLVTIPKYQGKTNEQFTRLLVNVTLACVRRPLPIGARRRVLDPMAGRGTTLTTAWLLGHDGFGVEADAASVEAMSAFLTTWLRRKRVKHTAGMHPVRREGKSLGRKFEADLRLPDAAGPLTMSVFTGDARQSAALFGKARFDAVITDAPYGVVHGAVSDAKQGKGQRDRSPAALLHEAIPVWATQLYPGGALGISWNTFGLAREDLAEWLAATGLEVMSEGPWLGFAHRVDASINRDLMVAVKPL